jgi:uncharacterized membrane protein
MRKFLMVIPLVHLLMFVAIWLDIPIFRQIIVFIYLSFIPGFVILKILRLKETNILDIILFSVGLSIAFLMFVGLLINELFLAFGISEPLSTIPLTIILGSLTLILFFFGYRQDLSENFSSIDCNFIDLKSVITKSAILVMPVLLGIIGALYINQPILLLSIIVIAAIYGLSLFSIRLISSRWYPLVIFAVCIALALQLLLTSKYIMGYDAKLEYYVFRLTSINGNWTVSPVGIMPGSIVAGFNSMLSITILPTIYSALLNINGEIVFETLYPFIFCFVPVTLYHIFERQIGKSAALLSSLFYVSGQYVFYGVEPLSLNRQIVAEFFLVLSILVLLDKNMSIERRKLFLVVFGAALLVSHYSLMFIYLFLVFCIYAISKFKRHSDEVLNSSVVSLLFVMAFLWYSLSLAPLNSLSQMFHEVIFRFFTDMSSPAARSSGLFAPHPIFNIASLINWVFFYIANFLVLIGVLVLLFKLVKIEVDPKFRQVTLLCAVILLLCLVVPNIAPALNLTRFYAITLLFLAPCFVFGGKTLVGISENILKKVAGRHSLSKRCDQICTILLCAVLIGYFLSESGLVNCVAGASPLSYPLDYNRIRTSTIPGQLNSISFYSVYISEQDVFSAVWLSKNIGESSTIYADSVSSVSVLPSYGLIPMGQISSLTDTTILTQGSFIYLGQLNVADGIITTATSSFNTSEIYPILNMTNLVYSNGNSEIWYSSLPG